MELQDVKNRFGIIGNSPLLNRAISVAQQVAPTDISVLITGESGSGKEVFSHIIHQMSSRKHGPFIAVNCGAIPEGTIDSELFGHEKGSFTSAHEARKGYFEVVNGGTIFLDEVAELPVGTQARLLRVLETGEYIRVGSSKVQKTNVRVIAATNVDVYDAVMKGKFREDLYYRLNTVPLKIPSLRERQEDIYLIFRKFIADFADKYHSPLVQLSEDAKQVLANYEWPGNVRQLKNIAEQIAVLENEKEISAQKLVTYIPYDGRSNLPVRIQPEHKENDFSERDILYKVLFDMRKDITDLKKAVSEILHEQPGTKHLPAEYHPHLYQPMHEVAQVSNALPGSAAGAAIELNQPVSLQGAGGNLPANYNVMLPNSSMNGHDNYAPGYTHTETQELEETLSLGENETELIRKALKKHKGKRKSAASELGISERTLYRKIKEYNL